MQNKIDFKTLQKINEEFGNFEIGQICGGSNSVYFRFGYWMAVNAEKLNEILGNLNEVVEDADYDDDCGYRFSYILK